ncbi:hypothetical protein M1N91_00500 [Dehalococcoidia bacterium]|nr:hypothetical protein [Dehalococcoidia bacterium]
MTAKNSLYPQATIPFCPKSTQVVMQPGQVIYDEFYPEHSKPVIDKIDRVLAQHYGFTDEEVSSSTMTSNTAWVGGRGALNVAAVPSASRDMTID